MVEHLPFQQEMEVRILWAMPVHLAQSVERKTFNLVVAGSSPAVDIFYSDSSVGRAPFMQDNNLTNL